MNYFNSTIQKKIGKCIDCPSDSPETYLTAGRCWTHYSPHRKKLMLEKQKAKSKFKSLEHTEKNREILIKNGKVPNPDLELFYRLRRHEMTGHCTEPGCPNNTKKKDDKYYRWSICHITPKSLIKSVATNQYNWIELCWIHHQEFDSTFERQSKMKCFPQAKRKFNLFKDLIDDTEMKWVNPYLCQG